jgi:hypothetical protein
MSGESGEGVRKLDHQNSYNRNKTYTILSTLALVVSHLVFEKYDLTKIDASENSLQKRL